MKDKIRAYLIYHAEEAVKNEAFIRLFQRAGEGCGIQFLYVPFTEYQRRELPDLVLNRTREAVVSHWYEERGIPVFHSEKITQIGNHKGRTISFLRERLPKEILKQKWAPETTALSGRRLAEWLSAIDRGDYTSLTELIRFWEEGSSFVIKSVDGHGGSEVMAFSPFRQSASVEEKRRYWGNFAGQLSLLKGRECIIQEQILSDSKDVRVYILGNQIYQGILRQGVKDFRSNFSLGGRTEVYSFSKEEREYIEKFLCAFRGEILGLAGLDFMIDREGRLIFNELEEMAGCRMLYQNTEGDVVEDYVRWLKEQLGNW